MQRSEVIRSVFFLPCAPFFTALSAFLFPGMPIWARVYRRVISVPLLQSFFTSSHIFCTSISHSCPFQIIFSAALVSVKIVVACCCDSAVWMAWEMVKSSVLRTTLFLPRCQLFCFHPLHIFQAIPAPTWFPSNLEPSVQYASSSWFFATISAYSLLKIFILPGNMLGFLHLWQYFILSLREVGRLHFSARASLFPILPPFSFSTQSRWPAECQLVRSVNLLYSINGGRALWLGWPSYCYRHQKMNLSYFILRSLSASGRSVTSWRKVIGVMEKRLVIALAYLFKSFQIFSWQCFCPSHYILDL